MYVEIKDNKLLSWCENPYLDYEYVDIDYKTFNPDKYNVINDVLTDISDTQEYKDKVTQAEKEKNIENLKSKIDDLDKKRIRAIAEPALKDAENGQTWLEFYTDQIKDLRQQIAAL